MTQSALLTPRRDSQPSRVRSVLALSAAVAGGLGMLGFALAAVAGLTPARASWLWVASGTLVAFWLTGIWSRGHAPDAREAWRERERRGF